MEIVVNINIIRQLTQRGLEDQVDVVACGELEDIDVFTTRRLWGKDASNMTKIQAAIAALRADIDGRDGYVFGNVIYSDLNFGR